MKGGAVVKRIKLVYIGGGSKAWARVFMNDLALTEGLSGELALYDIDPAAAELNRQIGQRINAHPDAKSQWDYVVYDDLDTALTGADFVAISILPGTFDAMAVDVHTPERYGIYQSVGDTTGPGGVLRAMRSVPLFEGFARAIQRCCPRAWVINLTNPMTILVKTLYDVFPDIKAFGCCHEVFNAEDFLCCVAAQELGVPRPHRRELTVDASGVNHFTWITKARYRDNDLLALLPSFMEKFYDRGYCEKPDHDPDGWRDDPFCYGNKVKMDLFRRFGVLAAAGDRHLVEFLPKAQYLSGPADAEKWLYHLTTVDYRKADREKRIAQSLAMASGAQPVELQRSNEELVQFVLAILGRGKVVSNANLPNVGQMPQLPLGTVVETNCVFDNDAVTPVAAQPLPGSVLSLVMPHALGTDNLYEAIKARDLPRIFECFLAQPLCAGLAIDDARHLFGHMLRGTAADLQPWYDLSAWKF